MNAPLKALQALAAARHYLAARWRWARLRGPALEAYQERRARQVVRYAARHAPFYRRHWQGHDLADWRSLPTVDKRGMMDNFTEFNTRGIAREAALQVALQAERSRDFSPTLAGVTVGLSSGTSGHRGLFLVSPWEQAAWAGVILARALHPANRRGCRVAFFLRANSNLYEQAGGALIQLRYFDLMLPLEQAIPALNDFQPNILIAPPLLLGLLAQASQAGRLRIAPRRLISVAEVLEPQDRANLENVFQAPVHQVYQCTEGLLAVSCPAGGLHIQEDLVCLQFEALEDAASGQAGRVQPIVTDLWRTTQPIIRYRLNDVLTLDEQACRCGSAFRLIHCIEGRSDDVFYFESETGALRPFFPDTIRRMVLLAEASIEDYQAYQERPGHLRLHLSVAPAADFDHAARAVQAQVETISHQYGCRMPELILEPGLLPVAPGAKRRRVQRLWTLSSSTSGE